MSEPAWNCLPHDPQGFFGLPATFDRQDLKRQYNRLIKQFKPEKYPQEFQKIRAAYDALDQRLR
ncbi:MAG: J domain-containing protein, partial [Planctomycetaceae bacterium]|nr:J domain-containing protein [Planctomycetaceae bacterium]